MVTAIFLAAIMSTNKPCPVEVNTVDGFQGREKDCIIVSTVRAASSDSGDSIGFLRDARRMNVTLTRARQNLWVVGSRATLSRNDLWAKFLGFVGDSRILEIPQVTPAVLSRYHASAVETAATSHSVNMEMESMENVEDLPEPVLEEVD